MTNNKQELLKRLADCVVEMDEEEAVVAAREYLQLGYPAFEGIMEGLVAGMNETARLYDEEEYFITDVLLSSDAMYAGLEILKPHLKETDQGEKIKAVIGVVQGDTHDIGKNLVKIMMETAGFEMHDLGRDVPLMEFIRAVRDLDARLVIMSTLMTTTMPGMGEVIDLLSKEGLRNQVKVMIGGGPISPKYAEQIGADGYSANAVEAVRLAKRLLELPQ